MMEGLVIRELARREREKFLAAEHAHYCVSSPDPDVANERRKAAAERILELGRAIFPWLEWGKAGVDRDAIRHMNKQWKKIWGDPNDPIVSAQIDSVVRHLSKEHA